ncbi:MAG TPA: amino acid adenylation domain-containing protein [Streptosporangiaceae bacterium]|jgi:amino acid adenylation domain-containing protein
MLTDPQREALMARLRRGRENLASGIPRRPPGLAVLPPSYGQDQLWFLDRFAPGLPTYNIPLAVRLSGPLDAAALARALAGLAERHETLRTRLTAGPDGRPVQVIDAPAPVPLELTDLSGLDPVPRQARLREILDTQAMRPFALPAGPLLRTWLMRLGGGEHVLGVVAHHVVFDGWSAGIFVAELAALYEAQTAGTGCGLADLPVQFADYALWERARLTGPLLDELAAYWRGALDGCETLRFPTDRPRPVLDSFEGGLAQRMTSPGLLAGLRELSRREGATLFVTLMAGLQALLHRYTGQRDIVVGTVNANRTRPELASLIGFLVNTLPIRADLSGDPPFTELLARVKAATTAAYAHQDLPFSKLVDLLRVERDPSRPPVFQIALSYAERDDSPVHAAGVDFCLTDLVVGINAAKFDLDFLAEARPDGLWFECSYKTRLFDEQTVRRLLGHWEVLLAGAVADPGARLSQLPMLTAYELARELVEWNDTAREFPVMCVHQAFEAQVARTPAAVAAEFGRQRVTYAELNAQANRVARRLRTLLYGPERRPTADIGPETLVGVCLPAGVARLAALLGIWKAGGGYVPLDPRLPPDRLAFLMADAAMAAVVTDTAGAACLAAGDSGPPMVNLEAGQAPIAALDDTDLADGGAAPASVAYVIYTSGSTGEPKGVVVEHRSAANFLHGMIDHWGIGPPDVVLQFASLSFDASVQEMFMPLLAGARVVLADPATLHSPRRLAALMRQAGVTFACLTPSVASLIADEQFPALRVLMCGGEEMPADLPRRWLRPGLRFVNDYGPTETTVTALFLELDSGMQPPPIGRPVPNGQAYVLDEWLNPVPAGVVGELHIGGVGVARGYLNRPALTRDRFIPDRLRPGPGARLYKTGDLVRRRPDGTVVFAGRIDNQVKIRGLRMELGEIEAALTAHPGVAQAVVTVTTDPAGDKQLAAYLRLGPGAPEVSPPEMRGHLARLLPPYMLPAYLTTVASFPLSTSGKIDRSALPPPQPGQDALAGYVPPATLIETMVASLYATLLGLERVGATDGFFDLGGNSLKAMRLVAMMDDELDVDLDVASVFLAPSPRELGALLRDKHGFTDAATDELTGTVDPGVAILEDETC